MLRAPDARVLDRPAAADVRLGRLALIPAAVFAVALAAAWPRIWVELPFEAAPVAALVAAAMGWGAWPARWLGFACDRPIRQVCVAAGLGLALIGDVALGLGVVGLLSATTARVVVVVGLILGVLRLARTARSRTGRSNAVTLGSPPAPRAPWLRRMSSEFTKVACPTLCALVLAMPLGLAFYHAGLPPGVIWSDDGFAYDARSYHLQCQREYFDAGRIMFLPHNVYASFPQQVEILFLVLMHLVGGPLDGAIPSQQLHVAFGILAVTTLYAWSPRGVAGCVVLLAAGSVPWLGITSPLAYVEMGVLFYAALAGALVIDPLASDRETACDGDEGKRAANESASPRRRLVAAGLFAGLSVGCKYTAAGLVVLPLAAMLVLFDREGIAQRVARASKFAAVALLAFLPWAVRNVAFTGNPVFPLATGVLGGRDWTVEQAARWQRGHSLPPERSALDQRFETAIEEIFAGGRFGVALLGAALLGVAIGRDRRGVALLFWAALTVALWMFASRMPGRFLVPIVVPLALLIRSVAAAKSEVARWLILILVAAMARLIDIRRMIELNIGEIEARLGANADAVVGATQAWAAAHPLNDEKIIPADAYVWIVGDAAVFHVQRRMHYTAVFNRDPWIEHAESGADARSCVEWLRKKGVTHVVFHWSEIDRLSAPGNYGFSPIVTRAWAAELTSAGLAPVAATRTPAGAPVLEVFRVTQ